MNIYYSTQKKKKNMKHTHFPSGFPTVFLWLPTLHCTMTHTNSNGNGCIPCLGSQAPDIFISKTCHGVSTT